MGVLSRLIGRTVPEFRMPFFRYRKPHQPWERARSSEKFKKNLWLMNGGILLLVFAGCYLMVPFYRMFCEATGLVGDQMQKDYSQIIKDGKKLHFHRKYNVIFKGETDPELDWTFEPVQDTVTVHAGEPALMFYKTYNKSDKPLVGIALYSVFPEDAGYYFSKVQCFCFNQQVLNGKEELQMPLYFYLEPEIDEDRLLHKTQDITIVYKFYLAKNQDLAKWMENQQKWEFEQQTFLRQKRKEKLLESGQELTDLENDQEIEKMQILTIDPNYQPGSARPNDITQFKHSAEGKPQLAK